MALDSTKILFSTQHNIQKIHSEGGSTASVPVSGAPPNIYTSVLTVTHDLGYLPTARVFYEPLAGELWPLSPNQYLATDGGTGTALNVFGRYYVTTTTLVVELANLGGGAANVPISWRIYVDAQN